MFISITISTLAYLTLVKYLRHRRIKKITKKLGYENLTSAEIYKRISVTDAQLIQSNMVLLEFPKIYHASLQFALFKVCCTFFILRAFLPRLIALDVCLPGYVSDPRENPPACRQCSFSKTLRRHRDIACGIYAMASRLRTGLSGNRPWVTQSLTKKAFFIVGN